MKYADVILPLPLENSYTYHIPEDMEKSVVPGCRVIVHFGKKKYYTAIVMAVHDRKPESNYETKDIYAILDLTPVLRRPQLRFWQWISEYYICKLGDVYKAAVPSGLKLESETAVSLNENFQATEQLRPAEIAVLDALSGVLKLTVSELEKKTGLRNVVPIISSLMQKEAIVVNEEIKQGFTPKTQSYVRLCNEWKSEEKLQEAFELVKRAPKQETLLLAYIDLSHCMSDNNEEEISKKELLERSNCSSAVLDALVKRGILEIYDKEISRLTIKYHHLLPLNPLSEAQKKAYDKILDIYREKNVSLLYGVTSSGKTEIYIHLIRDVLELGKQVLYMLPEIAITTQITERLSKLFGDKLLVYHSKFSDNERVEVWNTLLKDSGPRVILGVRSSLFLPFSNLGLVIVDEEHENTYKQQDPAPRYNARNAAIVLAGMHGAKTLLGSATPSIESYFNASCGKFGLVELTQRFGNCLLPEIIPVNTRELKRKKIMKDSLFSPLLIEKINSALNNGEQVILFQNRRGFAPVVECKSCGWTPKCNNCDISLTYHKRLNHLSCHYCGYTYQLPNQCPECQSTEFKMMGFGTEKVEEEISTLFPEAKVARMDLDTARTRAAYERIIDDFEKGKNNILIGTQMLSKGLDFGNVSVVGILNADSLMNFPDFRAHERAFQLMLQVSGRAGRRDKQGVVILQTGQPEHPLINMVQRFAYKEMFSLQLSERSMFHYPPYHRLIILVLRCKNESILQDLSRIYADKLRKPFGDRVLGPVTPPVTFVQTLHIRKIVIKIESSAAIIPVRNILEQVHKEMMNINQFKQIIMHYDVDPV